MSLLSYAVNGNMTANSRLGAYTYPNPGNPRPHAPTAAGPRTFAYDANGNMTRNGAPGAAGTQACTWDGENRLTSAAITGGNTSTFTYAPDGSRIKKTAGAANTYYFWLRSRIEEFVQTPPPRVSILLPPIDPASFFPVLFHSICCTVRRIVTTTPRPTWV